MAQDPAFLMYYGKWLNSTSGWDADVKGWYIDLLCHQADKPEGLPSDLEELAVMAGVKFSHFSRFKQCWERTLKDKFKQNDQGLLVNLKQQEVLSDRRDYIEKQSLRGRIGYFIKLVKKKKLLPEEYIPELAKQLEEQKINEKTKEQSKACFEHTLEALMININTIKNTNTDSTENADSKKSSNNGLPRKSVLPQGIAESDNHN